MIIKEIILKRNSNSDVNQYFSVRKITSFTLGIYSRKSSNETQNIVIVLGDFTILTVGITYIYKGNAKCGNFQ